MQLVQICLLTNIVKIHFFNIQNTTKKVKPEFLQKQVSVDTSEVIFNCKIKKPKSISKRNLDCKV